MIELKENSDRKFQSADMRDNKRQEFLDILHDGREAILMIVPSISNECPDFRLHIDHDDGTSKSKQVFNLFLRINIHHQLVCIQNIPWLLVLSRESHLKWRYFILLRVTGAHTTVSNLYSIYVSDTRDKKFKLYVFLHLQRGGNVQVSSGLFAIALRSGAVKLGLRSDKSK